LNLEAKRIWVADSSFAGVMDVQHRLPKLVGMSKVSLVPPLRMRSRLKITVPSLSSMFLLVHAGYEVVESSTRLYRSLDSPVLCLPAPGNIAHVFQACLDREIQSGSIGSRLAARYDFSKHFEQLVALAFQSYGWKKKITIFSSLVCLTGGTCF
jgi:hypothetical protein